MKKIIILLSIIVIGCTHKIDNPSNIDNSRIKIIEFIIINGIGYKIIKVDSIEYFTIENNCIIKLSK